MKDKVIKPQVAAEKPSTKPAAKAVAAAKPAPKAKATDVAKSATRPSLSKTQNDATTKTLPVAPVVKKKSEPVTTKIHAEPVAKAAKTTAVPTPSPAAKAAPAPTASVASTPQLTPLGVPVRSGRPSSRLAQLTVPSMAQSVASTAAKASYSQTPASFVIVPMIPASVKKDSKLANNWKTKQVADLKDTELMAMPDSEYMNEVQLAAFRLKLSSLKRDILNSAGETTEHLREDTSVVPDPADRATIEEEHALELRTRDRERKLLKKIEQSIARIDAGDYGYCDETGEPIGVGRLLARPTATLSLEAQQRRELKQKMFGD